MNGAVTVRKAAVEDARGIARVLVDGWRTTYADILPPEFLASFDYDGHETGTRQHLESLPTTSAVFVAASEDGSVVGVAHVREGAAGPTNFSAELASVRSRGASAESTLCIPLGRLSTPMDSADVVVLFASEEVRWMTGQVVHVAGGHAL